MDYMDYMDYIYIYGLYIGYTWIIWIIIYIWIIYGLYMDYIWIIDSLSGMHIQVIQVFSSRQLRTDDSRDVLSSGLATPKLQPLEAGGAGKTSGG